MLRGLSRAPGSALWAAGLVGVSLALWLGLSSAFGATGSGEPPEFITEETHAIPYSTRAIVVTRMRESALETAVEVDLAPAEAGGQAPPEASSAWTIVNSATGREFEGIAAGEYNAKDPRAGDPSLLVGGSHLANRYLRHLSSATHYYVRFIARNAAGEARQLVPFTTRPAAAPEVPVRWGFLSSPEQDQEIAFSPVTEGPTTVDFGALLETNGSDATYHFEYALPEAGHAPPPSSPAWKPFSSGASGSVTTGEEYAWLEPTAAGLTPETTYYVRVRAANATGESIESEYGESRKSTFTTETARPGVGAPAVRNVSAEAAAVSQEVSPHGSQTSLRLELASSAAGPWSVVAGSSATIGQAQAESLPYAYALKVGARLSGLEPQSEYFLRTSAENTCAQGCGSVVSPVASFRTTSSGAAAPTAAVYSAHAIHEDALRLLGWVNPNGAPLTAEQVVTVTGASAGTFTLSSGGHTSAPIAYDAPASAVQKALERIGVGVIAEGVAGGPYTLWFSGSEGEQPVLVADGSGLSPGAAVGVSVTQQGGGGVHAHYRFQYVSRQSFSEHGFAEAQESPEADAGAGATPDYVGFDLPSLTPGESYRYRIAAVSGAPGAAAVYSEEASLTVPAPAPVGEASSCSNEAFRVGASANLPDCRAYELVSPANKEGAQEPFHYTPGGILPGFRTGEDGEHVALEAFNVNWGTAGQSPYLFSRAPGAGWPMTAGAPQPQTGPYRLEADAYSADATQVAFTASFTPSATEPFNAAPTVELEYGPVGGPYTTVASIPTQVASVSENEEKSAWVAANGDFSKLVLATADRTLIGETPTATKTGPDLYEYTPGVGLRQLNVSGEAGQTIGVCGANMAKGYESGAIYSSAHSISADGARVFFEAVPGASCEEPKNLYMRVNGESTVDIGAYAFAGANAQGTRVLLRKGAEEFFLYDAETASVRHLFNLLPEGSPRLSSQFAALYVLSGGDLYRYDIAGEKLTLAFKQGALSVLSEGGENPDPHAVSPDGRYYYFKGVIEGLPSGGHIQVFRYDALENAVECISCASSFDPEPKLAASLDSGEYNGITLLHGAYPQYSPISANGEFAFFVTPAALVSQDVNGEIPVTTSQNGSPLVDTSETTSPSTDVYEWRRDGVDGCGRLGGCLALISDGRKGFHVDLLGVAAEGRDVFFTTHSQLVPADTDNQGDIYDARIGGGFAPPPPSPVECEGDACSTPPPPPADATPSSLAFSGPGNLMLTPAPAVAPVAKPKLLHKRCKPGARHRCVRRAHRSRARVRARRGGSGSRGRR